MTHLLHLGDCLEGLRSLPDKSVDHVITDPPYSDNVHADRNATRHLNGYEVPQISFDALDKVTMGWLAREFARVVRRWVLIFCADAQLGDWRNEIKSEGLEYVRTGIYVKKDPMPQMTGDRPAQGFELMALGHPRGRKAWNGGGRPMTYSGYRDEAPGVLVKKIHPTQKPLWLMEALIRDFTNPGELILDPYAGAATTGVAAKMLGRNFVGWERDPVFHAAAVKRLEAAQEQFGLFQGPRERATQLALPGGIPEP